MAKKSDNALLDIAALLARADDLLKEKKQVVKKRKGCKNHPDRLIYRSEECTECYDISHNLRNKKNSEKEPWISTDGYKKIYREDGTIQGYHRYVVEQALGIKLERKDQVKFKDDNPLNCSIGNLILLKDMGLDLSTVVCKNCREVIS